MKTITPILAIFVFTASLAAQTVPPALMVKGKDKSEPLGLSKLDIDVRIFGYVAETSTTMTFYNPSDRVLEGDLYFPLPEGTTVSGYALDIEGKLIDGVAVQKHKAREVFEKIVRQGIDPGLVEWTKGNNFKTRVFPIPAKGSRTIRVDYVTELLGGKRQGTAYHLPLKYKDKISEFRLRVEVIKPDSPPKVTEGDLANFGFEKWRDSYVAEAEKKDFAPVRDLVIALPDVDKQNILVEKAPDGQVYFCIHDFPPIPERRLAVSAPKRVVLYWDASGSRGAVDHQQEIALVKKLVDGFQKQAGGAKVVVELVFLRNDQSKPLEFILPSNNADQIIAALKDVQYDGGTQMGAISPKSGAKTPDFYLLFTDGISNFGKDKARGLDAPVYAISDDATADHAFLRHLAITTGGRYFNLKRVKDDDVVSGIGRSAFSFLAAKAEKGHADEMYPGIPEPITERFTLVGKLTGENATVKIDYGFPGQTSESRTFNLSGNDAVEGTLLRRLWAQKKLADLMVFQKRNEEEIVALGKQHGLVTPFTSLIVLDSLEQYVEHEIAPPQSLPKMREEYMRRVDTLEHQQKKQKQDKLNQVLAMWKERVKWWDKKYKYPKNFKYHDDSKKKEVEGRGQGAGGGFFGGNAPEADAPAEAAPATTARPAMPAQEPLAPEEIVDEEKAPEDAFDERPQGAALGPHNAEAAKKDAKNGKGHGRQPGIVIKPWDPKTPYMKELKAAKADKAFEVYMKNRAKFGDSPAFFLDCADFFAKQGNKELALQVLSNIAELELENPSLLRVLAHRLAQTERFDLAILTFEEVLRLRPEEPQSYRDLALVLARRAQLRMELADTLDKRGKDAKRAKENRARAKAEYARAMDLLNEVVLGEWDGRFPELEVIAIEELNAIIPKAKAAGLKEIPLDKRLQKLMDVDVRIVMTWHADNTDIDLWVIEPSGEQADYSHNRTTIGGLVSSDFTGGYGPEEYMVRRAMPGVYTVKANYYGSGAVKLLGGVTVQMDVFTNFGRENQRRKSVTLRLKEKEETVKIGEIEF